MLINAGNLALFTNICLQQRKSRARVWPYKHTSVLKDENGCLCEALTVAK